MYESFFGFQHRPFAAAPRIDRYFPGAAMEAARQGLARAIERAEGAGLIIGPSGTGKTLACHLLAEQFRGRFAVALLSNGHLDTRRELLQAILFELGLPYRRLEEGELRLSLIDYVAGDEQAREGLLLLVDEAHTLPPRLLEEIRLIANVVRHGQSRVRLVLAGDPGLEETLADPQLEALNQRIATRCYLNGLDHYQTQQYVLDHLAAVGAAEQVFTVDALEAVYRATDGIPRLINQVCDHALMLAFAGGRKQIHGAGIEEAWSDLQQLPMPWAQPQALSEESGRGGGVIEYGSLDDDMQPVHATETAVDDELLAPAVEPSAAAEATLLMHQIDQHLTELTEDFIPRAAEREMVAIGVDRAFQSDVRQAGKPDLCFGSDRLRCGTTDPFGESFDHEEVLVERYSSLEPGRLASYHHVASDEGRELAALLETIVQSSAPELALANGTGTERPALLVVSTAPEQAWFQSTTVDSQEPSSISGLTPLDDAQHSDADEAEESPSADGEAWEPPAVPLLRGVRPLLHEDDDLMIVEDDPRTEIRVHPTPEARHVRRQEFRQLFSSLRRG